MIIYELQCSAGHKFEGWFKDLKAYNDQLKKKLIQCTFCGTDQVTRIPCGCHVGSAATTTPVKVQQSPAPVSPQTEKVLPKPDIKDTVDYVTLLKSLHKVVRDNYENVGDKFTDMAIQIHKGEEEPKNIYGTADKKQSERLDEEGVPYLPLPRLPESLDN
ncbi:MAG: DUF1178 family protein [Deltaproteobacteria bacterium]|nr:DUF1178 family protein [Deltaproteobacteria bacterium]